MKKILFVATAVALCSISSLTVLYAQSFPNLSSTIPNVITPKVIITEVYGGGGNSGAVFNLDFIELFNTTSSQINLAGWSLQYYTSTASAASKIITFPENAFINPYSHFLVALTGGNAGTKLPGFDLQESAVLSSTSAKIALYSTAESQTIFDLLSIENSQVLIDYLPYGKAALPVMGTAMSRDCSATLSASRNKLENGTYVYTRNVGDDFSVASPNPEFSGLLNSLTDHSKNVAYKIYPEGINVFVEDNTRMILMDVFGKVLINKQVGIGECFIHLNQPGLYLLKLSGDTHKLIFHP